MTETIEVTDEQRISEAYIHQMAISVCIGPPNFASDYWRTFIPGDEDKKFFDEFNRIAEDENASDEELDAQAAKIVPIVTKWVNGDRWQEWIFD